jgi:hypothetical protein
VNEQDFNAVDEDDGVIPQAIGLDDQEVPFVGQKTA